MAPALHAWPIFIALLAIFISLSILAFWAGLRSKNADANEQIRRLKAEKELLDSRLQLARDQNTGEARTIADIRTEVDELRGLIKANADPSKLEPIIKEVDASAAALVMANSTTDHILSAQNLAIGNVGGTELETGSVTAESKS